MLSSSLIRYYFSRRRTRQDTELTGAAEEGSIDLSFLREELTGRRQKALPVVYNNSRRLEDPRLVGCVR
jgi:hypothetical protein